jgi:ubiquinone biosynthesis protein COQ9
MEEKQAQILEEFLFRINTGSGFSVFTFTASASKFDVTKGELDLLFPFGLFEVCEKLLVKHISEIEANNNNGITEGVKMAVLSSFNLLTPYKKAVRKIVKFLLLPQNTIKAPKFFWEISSAIWQKLGVSDNTFNYYSKRAILSGVYANCFLYFVLSKNHHNLEAILNKQLSLISKFKKR